MRDVAKDERSEVIHDIRTTCPPLAEPSGDDRREAEQRVNTPPLGGGLSTRDLNFLRALLV